MTGDTVPEPRDEISGLRLQLKQLRAARAAVTPREKIRKLQRQIEGRVVEALGDIVRRGEGADERITKIRARLTGRERKPVAKFFSALDEAFEDPAAGGVFSPKRLGILLKTLGEQD